MEIITDKIYAIRRMTCIEDITDIISNLGFEVIDIDYEGEELGSDFEWLDDRQEDV